LCLLHQKLFDNLNRKKKKKQQQQQHQQMVT
jgi:hypothetical protein